MSQPAYILKQRGATLLRPVAGEERSVLDEVSYALVFVRGDHEAHEVKVVNALSAREVVMGTAEEAAMLPGLASNRVERSRIKQQVGAEKRDGLQLDASGPGLTDLGEQVHAVIVPREGATLGVISTGWAREFNQDTGSTQLFGQNAQLWDTAPSRTVPAGFPKAAAACPSTETDTYDVVDVKLVLKAPPNAKGIAFDFNFFTSEWPSANERPPAPLW
mgnify:CR=1 FL=1